MKTKLFAAVLCIGFCFTVVRADTILLNDGTTVDGQIVSQAYENVVITTKNGELKDVSKSQIKHITKGKSQILDQNPNSKLKPKNEPETKRNITKLVLGLVFIAAGVYMTGQSNNDKSSGDSAKTNAQGALYWARYDELQAGGYLEEYYLTRNYSYYNAAVAWDSSSTSSARQADNYYSQASDYYAKSKQEETLSYVGYGPDCIFLFHIAQV